MGRRESEFWAQFFLVCIILAFTLILYITLSYHQDYVPRTGWSDFNQRFYYENVPVTGRRGEWLWI